MMLWMGLWSVHNALSLPLLHGHSLPLLHESLPWDVILLELILQWASHRLQLSKHCSSASLYHRAHTSETAPDQFHGWQLTQSSCSTMGSSPQPAALAWGCSCRCSPWAIAAYRLFSLEASSNLLSLSCFASCFVFPVRSWHFLSRLQPRFISR